jgi:hypothetical protein
MAIFCNLQIENVVQVNDKTRLDASKSFISKGEAAISLVEIEAESGAGFVVVSGTGLTAKDWYLDYEYATAGAKVVSCRITTNGSPSTKTFALTVLSVADDYLFSTDADLTALEHDILNYVPQGRNTFKNIHRKAQKLIMAWLDENGHTGVNGVKLTPQALVDKEEVAYWSAALCMQLIFSSISNDPNDVFFQKSKQYESMAITHRSRLLLRLDVDGDGVVSDGEGKNMSTLDMVRR